MILLIKEFIMDEFDEKLINISAEANDTFNRSQRTPADKRQLYKTRAIVAFNKAFPTILFILFGLIIGLIIILII